MKGRPIPFSAAELAFVEAHGAMKRQALHAAFVAEFARGDVTLVHIKAVCSRYGWTTGRKRWSSKQDALLRKLYPTTSTAEVARRIGRTSLSTYQRAQKLGLLKTEAYLASPAACRLRRGDNVGAAHRFPKGHAPANKGLRRPGWAPGRMKETQFKQGQRGSNWKPIGSERLVDGYCYTKVSDVRRAPWTVNWKPTHVLRWEALHGPLTRGMCLKSLDGNKENTDPSNWELIPRLLLLRLNRSRHKYETAPAELKPAILAIAKLEHAVHSSRRRREVRA